MTTVDEPASTESGRRQFVGASGTACVIDTCVHAGCTRPGDGEGD